MIPLIPREMEIDCETVPELKNIATLLNEMFVFNNMFNTSTLIYIYSFVRIVLT